MTEKLPTGWDMYEHQRIRCEELSAALSAAIGYMMNARIDLESGETKAKAIRTLTQGIEVADKPFVRVRQLQAEIVAENAA